MMHRLVARAAVEVDRRGVDLAASKLQRKMVYDGLWHRLRHMKYHEKPSMRRVRVANETRRRIQKHRMNAYVRQILDRRAQGM